VTELVRADGRMIKEKVRGSIRIRPPRRLSPQARAALSAYADGLTARIPGVDNPPGRKYYQEKIAEARQAARSRPTARGVPFSQLGCSQPD